jgi:plastocyanin
MTIRGVRASLGLVAWAGLVMAIAPLFAACGGGDDKASASNGNSGNSGNGAAAATVAPTTAPVVEIQISDNAFSPASVTVKQGTVVRWLWGGSNPHSVVIAGFKSNEMTGTGTFERPFTQGSGTYNYQCGVHGTAMTGVVIVE